MVQPLEFPTKALSSATVTVGIGKSINCGMVIL